MCTVTRLVRSACLTLPLSLQREKIREKFVAALKEEFAGKGLRFTKGERVES